MINTIFKYKSLISLILANLIPLFGVLFWGWDIFSMLVLYWIESLIIGIWNIPKMTKASGGLSKYIPSISDVRIRISYRISSILSRFFLIPFFTFHYGVFMLAHLGFLLGFREIALRNILPTIISSGSSVSYTVSYSGPISAFSDIHGFWIAALSLFISHGFSYVQNFIGNKECEQISPFVQMFQPYKRIVVMHITLLIGAVIFFLLGNNSVGFLIVFWALKMFLDIRAHLRERENFSEQLNKIQKP
ncbi:MAG: DUF6498-containing protein [Patescibacteria group bacterium]